MNSRQLISSGSPYEPIIGFSRAVRVGQHVWIAGTAPVWPDGSCDPDVQVQARRCFEIALTALEQAGGGPQHVVRTRMMMTDITDWEAIGRVHGEYFSEIRPVGTTVAVRAFNDPRWKVEIEIDAYIHDV